MTLAEKVEAAADRLESLIAMLQMQGLEDRIHVEALRSKLPEVAKDLRAALRDEAEPVVMLEAE